MVFPLISSCSLCSLTLFKTAASGLVSFFSLSISEPSLLTYLYMATPGIHTIDANANNQPMASPNSGYLQMWIKLVSCEQSFCEIVLTGEQVIFWKDGVYTKQKINFTWMISSMNVTKSRWKHFVHCQREMLFNPMFSFHSPCKNQ